MVTLTCARFTLVGAGYVFFFSSRADWFIGLPVSVVIGQSINFGFGLTTLRGKLVDATFYPN